METEDQLDPMSVALEAITVERDNLKTQLLHTQKAFLMQQRELNVLQMQQVERELGNG